MPDLFGDPTPDPHARIVRVWGDTVRRAVCRGAHCQAAIWFAENVKSGRPQPFDGEPTALRIEEDRATGRPIWILDAGMAHHATCPDVAEFRQGKTREPGPDDRTPAERRTGSRRYENFDRGGR